MAAIYLTHPVHGAKVATIDLEADLDVQNGWSRYNLEEQYAPQIEPKIEPQIEVTLAPRRGRPKKDVLSEGD
jgi:hypothetical protein